jgi:ribulose-5-phosphate 4-epimerase/fuculose-1-phosphate aldolase/sugar/nucleoside kinase (ribokinase family)
LTIFGITQQNSLADALCFFIGRPFNIRLMYRKVTDELAAARSELVSYGRRLLADGLSVGSAGNLSVRVSEALVAITPSGVPYRELTAADICLVAPSDAQLDGARNATPPRTASSETPMHLAIYAATNARAIVHTHSPEVIALSAARTELPAIHYAITALGGPVRVAPYTRFGSTRLAEAAVEALADRTAVILRNHGAVAYGDDLAQAYHRALLLEWLACTYRLALAYGEPSVLSAAQLDEVTAESRRRRYGMQNATTAVAESPPRDTRETPLGHVTVLGAHILDVLGRPVADIPPGQGSARLTEIRATAAGTAAGPAVDLAKLGARVLAVGAIGDDLLGDMVTAAMAGHGVDTSGLSRKHGVQTSATILPIRANGERPALHVPGATSHLELADVSLDRVRASRALLVGAPDALGGIVGDGLAQVVAAAREGGALVAVDVLHPGRPQELERIAGLLATADWFLPNSDQLRALTGRDDLTAAIDDILALGTGGVAVTCGADGCVMAWRDGGAPVSLPAIKVDVVDTTGCGDGFTAGLLAGLLLGVDPVDAAWLGIACGSLVATGLGSDAGIESLGQTLDFLSRAQPAVAARITAAAARPRTASTRSEGASP